MTLTRHPRALGYFCAGAFQDRDGAVAHEISMNPSWFEAQGDDGSFSTLVHEMVHLWRHVHGKANRKGGKGSGGYHDVVWADRMELLGLMPSKSGSPGGSRTGYSMSHYIIEGGRFDLACHEWLLTAPGIDWRDARIERPSAPTERGAAEPPALSPKNTRTRFVCLTCEVKAWSRASAKLACVDCNIPLVVR
ncbi:hypothetical protein AIGOOFII_3146 [Methylobacterium marchantiae]|nr:hypothetical protein AIGOOFII_3146 [Methylobacterium marchantiae]